MANDDFAAGAQSAGKIDLLVQDMMLGHQSGGKVVYFAAVNIDCEGGAHPRAQRAAGAFVLGCDGCRVIPGITCFVAQLQQSSGAGYCTKSASLAYILVYNNLCNHDNTFGRFVKPADTSNTAGNLFHVI